MGDYSSYMWSVPDWRTDEMYTLLDNREQGIYRNLLDECWVSGSITSDPLILARFVHESVDYFAGVWVKIRGKFRSIENGERLVSKRQEQDRSRLKEIRKNRKKSSSYAAKIRWDKEREKKDLDAERINSALRNHAQTQTQTQRNLEEGEILSVPPCDANTLENVVPEDSPQAKKLPTGRPRDLAMDFFAEKCLEYTKTPYVIESGDGVQLSKLRKAFGTGNLQMPPGWEDAVGNFFASPLSQYSLADLANPKRYAVFKNSALDGFNKPIDHTNRRNANVPRESEAEGRERRTAAAADRVLHEVAEKISGNVPSGTDQRPDRGLPGNARRISGPGA